MRAMPLDNGGQGCSKTVMANQSHDRGEPSKLDNGYPASRVPVGEPKYAVVPITVKAARQWVRDVHRDLPSIQGGLFAVAVEIDGKRVAAGIAVNPPRVWQGTGRIVIGRVAALSDLEPVGNHAAPACTMIYGSLCRAAKALGYSEAWTYTLPGESGVSLRAAGFTYMGETKGGEWDRPSRPRSKVVRSEKKGRWMRQLSTIGPKRGCNLDPALTNAKGSSHG